MSVDFSDVKAAVDARMRDNWTATPVAYQNFGYDPSQHGNGGEADAFVRIRAVERGSEKPVGWNVPETSAPCLYGEIHAMVYVPLNTGTDALEQHLNGIKTLFEGVQLNGTTTRIQVMESSVAAEGEQSPWYAKLIVFRLRADNNPA